MTISRAARGILLGLSMAFAAAGQTAPVAVPPASQDLSIGKLRVTALRDLSNVLPNDGKVFGKDVGPGAVADALRAAGLPDDRITLGVQALLVRMGQRVVLIDTGMGEKAGGVLIASLAQAGVAPARVTDILITHSHPDHIGGLLDAQGVARFPNASIHMAAAEWAWLSAKPAMADFVKAVGPRIKGFTPGAVVLPGIMSVSLPGHTPGHVGYRIGTGRNSLIDIGDTAHSSLLSLTHPDWVIGFDTDADAGRTGRKAELAALAKRGQLIFSPHFPFPGFGRIVAQGDGYRWAAKE